MRHATLALLTSSLLLLDHSAASARSSQKAGARTATARIDRRCHAKPAKIVIPAGKRAFGFKLKRLTRGTWCVKGGTPKDRGFTIKRRGAYGSVYRFYQWKQKRPVERPVKLGKLVLRPGVYFMYVGGGGGARASVRYKVR